MAATDESSLTATAKHSDEAGIGSNALGGGSGSGSNALGGGSGSGSNALGGGSGSGRNRD
jgi:hypothetical protein